MSIIIDVSLDTVNNKCYEGVSMTREDILDLIKSNNRLEACTILAYTNFCNTYDIINEYYKLDRKLNADDYINFYNAYNKLIEDTDYTYNKLDENQIDASGVILIDMESIDDRYSNIIEWEKVNKEVDDEMRGKPSIDLSAVIGLLTDKLSLKLEHIKTKSNFRENLDFYYLHLFTGNGYGNGRPHVVRLNKEEFAILLNSSKFELTEVNGE